MNLLKTLSPMSVLRAAALVLTASVLNTQVAKAMPYASCITNNNGTIQFYLNESGGNVTVSYEDNSKAANFNGTTTGLVVTNGQQSFALGSHTSYTISVAKVGTGVANTNFVKGVPTARGIDVNKNPTSPYFGNVYCAVASVATPSAALWRLNSDLSGIITNGGGVTTWTNSASEPYRIAVNDDDYLTVGSFAGAHSGVWRIDPTLTSNQLLLGPVGQTAGYAANSQGDQFSRPLLIGNLQSGGTAQLLTVDAGNIPNVNSGQLNSVLVYNNITLANLPRITAPDMLGPEVCLNLVLNNNYPGITYNKNTGYVYCSNRRDGPSGTGSPTVQIYSLNNLNANTAGLTGGGPGVNLADPTQVGCVWDSYINITAQSDYFDQDGAGPADSAVSADGKYFATVGYGNNAIKVVALTNGIPDVSTLYTITNKISTTSAGRGICWDAADNIYVSSSGAGNFQAWTLGFTATAITTGNASGPTGFSLVLPSTQVSVYGTNATQTADALGNYVVSQANSHSNPTAAQFVITRTGNLNAPLTVPFTMGGTAANTTYTTTGGSSVTFAANQSSTNITITAVTDSVPRPTTSIVLTLTSSGSYTLAPGTATLSLLNTATPQLVVKPLAATMYNAFSNSYASFIITRWGDLNAATFSGNLAYSGGTAVAGVDFSYPSTVTFNPGDVSYTNYINPLNNGQLPVHSTANAYVGNKTVIVSIASGGGYTAGTNTALLNILDSAYPTTTPLYADPLTSAGDAANWTVTSANGNMHTNAIDNTITFGYDLQNGDPTDNGAIPLPPSGATTALRLTVNKNSPSSQGATAGVNLYPNSVSFSGNYAVRFSMNIIEGTANTTEGPMFGINHAGIYTNWWGGVTTGWDPAGTNTAWASDGIWYWVAADNGAGQGEYEEFTGLGGTLPNTGWQLNAAFSPVPFDDAFPTNVFTTGGGPGIPANGSILNGNIANNWADVEIKQINNVVTLSIDKTRIFTYTNTTAFTSGKPMLGYDDPFASVGSLDASVYYSNLRVVSVAAPIITQIIVNKVNSTAVINFTTADGDTTASSFTLQSAATVNGAYANNAAATITQLSAGAFQAVVPLSGAAQFYRVSQN